MLKELAKTLEQMEASFNSDAKSVKECSNRLEMVLFELKNKLHKNELTNSNRLESTLKLLEKLSILNEYKLNLFKDFSLYNYQKK